MPADTETRYLLNFLGDWSWKSPFCSSETSGKTPLVNMLSPGGPGGPFISDRNSNGRRQHGLKGFNSKINFPVLGDVFSQQRFPSLATAHHLQRKRSCRTTSKGPVLQRFPVHTQKNRLQLPEESPPPHTIKKCNRTMNYEIPNRA